MSNLIINTKCNEVINYCKFKAIISLLHGLWLLLSNIPQCWLALPWPVHKSPSPILKPTPPSAYCLKSLRLELSSLSVTSASPLTQLILPTFPASFLFFLINLFIYLFLAALGLCCCVRASSSCSERGYSSLWCAGFSLRWLLLLRSMGFRRAGFSSCGSRALEHRLNSCGLRAQ